MLQLEDNQTQAFSMPYAFLEIGLYGSSSFLILDIFK